MKKTKISGNVSVKGEAAKPRRSETGTTKNRAAEKGDAAKRGSTRKTPDARGGEQGTPRRAPTRTPTATKPRRIGTKLTRLLSSNVANSNTSPTNPRPSVQEHAARNTGTQTVTHWLLYCRPGFEQDCAQEALRQARAQRPVIAEQPAIVSDSGYVVIALNEHALRYSDLIFARQLIRLHQNIPSLPERDRLTPIVSAVAALPDNFGKLWLEVADTNDGKTLSAFTRRFGPLLETALQDRLAEDVKLHRLHLFFPDKSAVLIGTSDPYNSASNIMGIARQSMPGEAPSRSTLKLAEAIEAFLDKSEQTRLLRAGMTAVDLGAAPGGWTWQMVRRGIRVVAVDNGPMKGVLVGHALVEHLQQDGFKYTPRKAVDWLICDMVEKPSKVAELIANWFASGWCKHSIFNLKLPMKQRNVALDAALGGIRKRLDEEGISYRMVAKQLYHDREEVTVFLTRTKNR